MPDYNPIGNPALGIVYCAYGTSGFTYTDAEFNLRPAAAMDTAYVAMDAVEGIPDTPRPWVSRSQGLTLFVEVTGTHGGETLTVKVEARLDESRPWNLMQTVRQDTGLAAAEHAIDFATGQVMLQTDSEYTTGQIQVSVKSSTGDTQEGNSIIIRGQVA